jgi:hypothetical protein
LAFDSVGWCVDARKRSIALRVPNRRGFGSPDPSTTVAVVETLVDASRSRAVEAMAGVLLPPGRITRTTSAVYECCATRIPMKNRISTGHARQRRGPRATLVAAGADFCAGRATFAIGNGTSRRHEWPVRIAVCRNDSRDRYACTNAARGNSRMIHALRR